jgi:hypothetical protein
MAAKKLFRLSVQFLSSLGVVVEKELFSCQYSFFPALGWWWRKTIPLIGTVSFQPWSGGGERTILLSVQFLSSLGVVVEKELFSCQYSFFPALGWWWRKTIPLIGTVSFH